MPAQSPLELLAEELGIVAGRVERETSLKVNAVIADVERRFAQQELQIERLQKKLEDALALYIIKWDQLINERIASLKNGKDGAEGKAGPIGPSGLRGETGVQGMQGDQGERGMAGIQGEKGDKGDRGEIGPQGPQGERGSDGENIQGASGEKGEKGEKGDAGAQGEKGEAGPQGERGAQGETGKLPKVKRWIEGAVSYDGDVVTHNGGLYQALKDTGKTPGTNDWLCLASPGVDGEDGHDGEDGKSFTIRDTFDPLLKYTALDVVTLDSKWFVAKYDEPGLCPGPGWKAGPGIGKTGRPGERGAQGERGLEGKAGLAAPVIIDWEMTKDYDVIPKLSDGSSGPIMSLRELFAQFQAEAG